MHGPTNGSTAEARKSAEHDQCSKIKLLSAIADRCDRVGKCTNAMCQCACASILERRVTNDDGRVHTDYTAHEFGVATIAVYTIHYSSVGDD